MVNNFLIFDVGCNGGINALADIATVVSRIEEGLKMANYFLITYVGSQKGRIYVLCEIAAFS